MNMNIKNAKGLMVLLAGMFAAPMAFAQAAPGTGQVTFNGQLTQDTCVIQAGDEDQTVTLDTLSTQSLNTAGAVGGSKMFSITVANCPSTLNSVAAHFETTNMDPATQYAKNVATVTPAGFVDVRLLDQDGTTPLKLGTTGSFFPISGTGVARGATMNYGGEYYATAPTTPGNVTAIVLYTLAYQ